MMHHPKIQPNHLNKIAYLYLRQSTPKQLIDHQESQRVQLQLKEKLQQLGFSNVMVVDDDLGKSASGFATREGFGRILNDVCHERVGAVAAWEASRLARSHFEWQNLIRFCQITGTLVIDEGGVYDPTNIDDIAMLGIKATMCEYELNILAKRARAGLLEKARRGELHSMLTPGYYLTEDGHYEMEPNERVQKTVTLLFDRFQQLGTARQVLLWFHQEQVEFPRVLYRKGKRTILWELPRYGTILSVLKNPAYAGAYVYGRRQTRTFIRDGQPMKTSGHPVAMEAWKVLIFNHHRAYISWERFLQNQQQLRDNSNKLSPFTKGAPKMGSSLLAGLLHCGHCGRKLSVKYSGRHGQTVRYLCRGAFGTTGQIAKCFSTSAKKLEEAVVAEVLKTVQPAAVGAAIEAQRKLQAQSSERQKMLELELEQARYEAERRERQYNAVEPENRLVSRELETQWNEALAKVRRLEQELKQEKENQQPLDESQCQKLFELAQRLPRLWQLPSTDERTKTRLIRTVIDDIIARAEPGSQYNHFIIRWAGGIHSEIRLKRYQRGESARRTPQDALEIVKELARITDDRDIARILNRCGLKTASGQSWNQLRVRTLRQSHHIPAFSKPNQQNADWVNLSKAAKHLEISPEALLRLIKAGLIKATQVVRYAPWCIPRSELTKPEVLAAVESIKKNGKGKIDINKNQLTL
jgi:DNA invertase Pin-like site-specific DNA recombinase